MNIIFLESNYSLQSFGKLLQERRCQQNYVNSLVCTISIKVLHAISPLSCSLPVHSKTTLQFLGLCIIDIDINLWHIYRALGPIHQWLPLPAISDYTLQKKKKKWSPDQYNLYVSPKSVKSVRRSLQVNLKILIVSDVNRTVWCSDVNTISLIILTAGQSDWTKRKKTHTQRQKRKVLASVLHNLHRSAIV